MIRKLTEDEVCEIFWEENPDYEMVEDGGWTSEGKYEHSERIFKDKDGKHWSVGVSRSGSYFTDYEYSYDDGLVEVEKKEIKTTKWVPVRD